MTFFLFITFLKTEAFKNFLAWLKNCFVNHEHIFYWILTEAPIRWPPHVKSWLNGKDPDAGRDWGQEEKGTTGDEMVGWHHWLDGHEFEWTLGVGDGQGGLVCCDPWGRKESDMTELLNWTELKRKKISFPNNCHFWPVWWFPGKLLPKGLFLFKLELSQF